MNENEGAYAAPCNKPGSDYSLAERGRRRKHADVVLHKRLGCRFLLCRQLTMERQTDRRACASAIIDRGMNAIRSGEFKKLGQASSRNRQMVGKVLGAINQPRFTESR